MAIVTPSVAGFETVIEDEDEIEVFTLSGKLNESQLKIIDSARASLVETTRLPVYLDLLPWWTMRLRMQLVMQEIIDSLLLGLRLFDLRNTIIMYHVPYTYTCISISAYTHVMENIVYRSLGNGTRAINCVHPFKHFHKFQGENFARLARLCEIL